MQKVDTADFNQLTDLNLMRMLAALIQTQSVTRSGELLGLSQPAASRTMAKLRKALNDPLLVRTSRGYVLTPLAQTLAPLVTKALAAAEGVFAATHFDPATSARTFQLATTDYGAQAVLTPLASTLVQQAPYTHVVASAWKTDTLADLENGQVDLALYADAQLPEDFHASELFKESYVLVVRAGHRLLEFANAPLPELLAAAATCGYIVARYPNNHLDVGDNVLKRLGAPMGQPTLSLPYFSTAPMIVAESDLIIALPSRLAQRYRQQLPIELIPLPTASETFGYLLIWHERAHRDPSLQWLRRTIKQLVSAS